MSEPIEFTFRTPIPIPPKYRAGEYMAITVGGSATCIGVVRITKVEIHGAGPDGRYGLISAEAGPDIGEDFMPSLAARLTAGPSNLSTEDR